MVISSPCLTDIKNWLVQKQTAFVKDFSNPFTFDSLLKTIWFSTHHALHAPCYNNEALAIPEQMATSKEISNPFMAGEDCWVLEAFTTYCYWFNIGATSEDLMLLRKIEENRLSLDGENLDKMKEKGDACIFVGYSTMLRACRVYNKRTRLIIETIHVNFDELPQMVSDHVSSDPVP
ncbi:hypothetical protein Tco_0059353 [Tanacetum coccineum]